MGASRQPLRLERCLAHEHQGSLMPNIITYVHHNAKVSVREDLKGQHRDFCLCYSCKLFKPGQRGANCPIADAVFKVCVKYDLVTPVWECLKFEQA